MEKIKFGIIGCGFRGTAMGKRLATIPEVEITVVCDPYEDKAENAAKLIAEVSGGEPAKVYTNSTEAFKSGIDAVLITSSWETHIDLAIESMENGVICGVDVAGAYNVDDCFKLVEVYERTKTPLMFLENCCYGKHALLATALVRNGILGEIVHCQGSYDHDIRDEIIYGKENRHYRLRNYIARNCENYPTHELGPIAKILDINRGNRMVSLVSVASKEAGLTAYVNSHDDVDPDLRGQKFNQGDIVNTIITCANGETICIRLNTSLPTHRSRDTVIRGTKGTYEVDCNAVFIEGMNEGPDPLDFYMANVNNGVEYEEKYLCEMWKKVTPDDLKLGHGGMDILMLREFVRRIISKEEMPLDVYDMAAFMAITPLSEKSIAEGGTAQLIPDFTHGEWRNRPRLEITDIPIVD